MDLQTGDAFRAPGGDEMDNLEDSLFEVLNAVTSPDIEAIAIVGLDNVGETTVHVISHGPLALVQKQRIIASLACAFDPTLPNGEIN
jgi:hypothetical protein